MYKTKKNIIFTFGSVLSVTVPGHRPVTGPIQKIILFYKFVINVNLIYSSRMCRWYKIFLMTTLSMKTHCRDKLNNSIQDRIIFLLSPCYVIHCFIIVPLKIHHAVLIFALLKMTSKIALLVIAIYVDMIFRK